MQNKKNTIIAVVVLVLVVGLGLVLRNKANGGMNNEYSVVYLTTGEVYIGQLSTFPNLELNNGYILQVTKDPTDATKSNFQLQPISQALWAPKSLHLTEKNVVFYGLLSPNSTIAKKIAEQKN